MTKTVKITLNDDTYKKLEHKAQARIEENAEALEKTGVEQDTDPAEYLLFLTLRETG